MARVSLISGAYQARGLIANAQMQVNLYTEQNTQDGPSLTTLYPTPGLVPFAHDVNYAGPGQCIYTASNGALFSVSGGRVYAVASNGTLRVLGAIVETSAPVCMVDNGLTVLIGSSDGLGWQFDLATGGNFGPVADPAFYGFTIGDFIDTFFLLNEPGTPNFYVSPSEYVTNGTTPFNALYFASKSTAPDPLVAVRVNERVIWLIGQYTTEFWYNSGASDFPFALQSSIAIEFGCQAAHSIAKIGGSILWLSRDKAGQSMLLRGSGYQVQRVSNHALEEIWSEYVTDDAVAWTYQLGGHQFYVISFPTSNATWVYDLTTGLFHQWSTNSGRHQCAFGTAAYGQIFGLDAATGAIYTVSQDAYTDNGVAIQRVRSFPHLPQTGSRIRYDRFIADMQASATSSIPVQLFISNDRGATYNLFGQQDLSTQGTVTQLQFRRLGLARDMVFKVSWSANAFTALNGAFVEMTECAT